MPSDRTDDRVWFPVSMSVEDLCNAASSFHGPDYLDNLPERQAEERFEEAVSEGAWLELRLLVEGMDRSDALRLLSYLGPRVQDVATSPGDRRYAAELVGGVDT